ncbi:MAG: hypothetical protein IKO65_05630 [Victivallales bacterium]|nr:hypothetical protein [Victivallales bacterium]
MANECEFEMTAVSKSRGALERLVRIMNYKDPEYFIYRVFDATLNGDIEDTEDGFYIARIDGDVAWSCEKWFSSEERPDSVHEATGAHYITLDLLCQRLGLGVEVYGQEPGMGFQEYHRCTHAGEVSSDCADWSEEWCDDEGNELSEPIEKGGLDGYGEESSPEEIYGLYEPSEVAIAC